MADDGAKPDGDTPSAPKKDEVAGTWPWYLKTLAIPIAVVLLPLSYQWMASKEEARKRDVAEERELREQQFRLYTDLMGKREDADTTVRRALFDKLIGSYLKPSEKDIDKRLVVIELLSLNFHDSLNLAPLFWELERDIAALPRSVHREALAEQLDRIAKEVKDRQAALLEADGFRAQIDVDLAFRFPGASPQIQTIVAPQISDDRSATSLASREFTVEILQHDATQRRLWVTIDTAGLARKIGFWVDPFDFPLVNFSRISRTERLAVLLDEYAYDSASGTGIAKLVLLYFPSWRSGAKDKPYLDDLMQQLRGQPDAPTPQQLVDRDSPAAGPKASAPAVPASR